MGKEPAQTMDNSDEAHSTSTPEEVLDALGRARIRTVTHTVDPDPDLLIDPITQMKLATVVASMDTLGALPGDFPRSCFQRPVRYRRLEEQTLVLLEEKGIPARREFAPLAAQSYSSIFGVDDRLPVSQEKAERFFGRLIHCLLTETQILLARQYFLGLGLYKADVPHSALSEVVPPDIARGLKQASPDQFRLDELRGRIFLEYCAIMIRAQWDKLTRLSCFVLGLDHNWDSISKGLQVLGHKLNNEAELHPRCRRHFQVFVELAGERLAGNGWLKRFRDSLLHDVGKHSAGVLPQAKSLETTSEMWKQVCDEHDWLREAMMAVLVAFLSVRAAMPPAK